MRGGHRRAPPPDRHGHRDRALRGLGPSRPLLPRLRRPRHGELSPAQTGGGTDPGGRAAARPALGGRRRTGGCGSRDQARRTTGGRHTERRGDHHRLHRGPHGLHAAHWRRAHGRRQRLHHGTRARAGRPTAARQFAVRGRRGPGRLRVRQLHPVHRAAHRGPPGGRRSRMEFPTPAATARQARRCSVPCSPPCSSSGP